ncbi:MAG: hypothetical protein EAZ35_03035 [Sphingobacteriia bacterium]|nr:MAG: hypothetical protein EAZ41_06245 [Sphingobacteriia bacterium]TAG31640.1 MAG: hypothetical protein EAZ35_03035 [Sphingobacteriia bacterium]
MRKILIFILIISHLNIALIPHLDEADMYSAATDSQVEDINTVYEFISVALGIDTTADDEDDDMANDSQITFNYLTTCPRLLNFSDYISKHKFLENSTQKFSFFTYCQINSIFFDIESPPPEA